MAEVKTAQAKQAELVKQITDSVVAQVRAVLEEQGIAEAKSLSVIAVDLSAIQARLESVESVLSQNGAKKPVKGERKTGGPKKAGGKKAADGDERDRVKNSMLYFRWAFANDDALYEEFNTEDAQGVLAGEEYGKKDGAELKKAQASTLWKSHLSEDDKKGVKDRYLAWRADYERGADQPQLEADGEAADGAAADNGEPDQPAPTDEEAPEPAPAPKKPAPKKPAAAKAPAPKKPAAAAPKKPAAATGAKKV